MPQRIENAMMLDGGHSGTIKLRVYTPAMGKVVAKTSDYGNWLDNFAKSRGFDGPAEPYLTDTIEMTR